MDRKEAIRRLVRERVRALDRETNGILSGKIVSALLQSSQWHAAGVVGLYAALGSEPMLDPVLDHAGDRILCFPRVAGHSLEFYSVRARSELSCGTGQLREPAPDPEKRVPHSTIDLLLVPGVAFTRDGHRLGRGGGYYDRFLVDSSFQARTIGVCFEAQIVPELPMLEHDQTVRAVLTENGFFEPREDASIAGHSS